MEHYYLFLIISTEFMSLEFAASEDSTENVTRHILMCNLIFSCEDNLGLLQKASYLDPSSKCTLIGRAFHQSAEEQPTTPSAGAVFSLCFCQRSALDAPPALLPIISIILGDSNKLLISFPCESE